MKKVDEKYLFRKREKEDIEETIEIDSRNEKKR
jgi:hypothetical protein